jgi:hypothetical protein
MDSLFFRESGLKGNAIELIFHKDFPYLYNQEEFPVIKFTLKNCQKAQSFDFAWLLDDNDGSVIEVSKQNNESVFEVTDSSGESLKIKCENILKEEIKYREADLYYLISELLKEQEIENGTITKLLKNLSQAQGYFEKELEIVDRKLKEANWLSSEKQEFLKGQKSILEKTIELLESTIE